MATWHVEAASALFFGRRVEDDDMGSDGLLARFRDDSDRSRDVHLHSEYFFSAPRKSIVINLPFN